MQRLWRDEGLRLPAKTKRRRRGPRMPGHLTAARPDQVWAIDFVSDQTAEGRPIKILTVTDEHTREATGLVRAEVVRHLPRHGCR